MTKSMIIGVDGQDGSYLAQLLASRGEDVIGVGRLAHSRYQHPPEYFEYLSIDVADYLQLSRALQFYSPDEIYHLAAVHGSAGFSYEAVWDKALAVNTGSVHACLEYLRLKSAGRLFYASSLKTFGTPAPKEISEATPRRSGCLYSITKNASADLIAQYRIRFGIESAIGYLFNHDSPRRRSSFFMPKLVSQLSDFLKFERRLDRASGDELNTLNFECDWGASSEFMELAVDLLRSAKPADALFVTGKPWTGWALADSLSELAGIATGDWVDAREARQLEIAPAPEAYPLRLQELSGRSPQKDALDVALWILAEKHGLNFTRPSE